MINLVQVGCNNISPSMRKVAKSGLENTLELAGDTSNQECHRLDPGERSSGFVPPLRIQTSLVRHL